MPTMLQISIDNYPQTAGYSNLTTRRARQFCTYNFTLRLVFPPEGPHLSLRASSVLSDCRAR
jgi:hypothetical protein